MGSVKAGVEEVVVGAGADKAESQESLNSRDSGYCETCANSGSSLTSPSPTSSSLASILRRPELSTAVTNTALQGKKKVSIYFGPDEQGEGQKERNRRKGKARRESGSESEEDSPGREIARRRPKSDQVPVSGVGPQLARLRAEAETELGHLHPGLARTSLALLFSPDLPHQLGKLSPGQAASLLYTLRAVLLAPPPRSRDIVLLQVTLQCTVHSALYITAAGVDLADNPDILPAAVHPAD